MLDVKEEKRYDELRRLGQELHLPIPEHFWTLEVFGKDGKLLQKHHQRSHSWVRNAYNIMFSTLAQKDINGAGFGAGILTLKKTSAAVESEDKCGATDADVDGTTQGYRAPAGGDDFGILVGSGTNAEDFEDYVLQTPIVEGAGAGQLNHAQSEAHSISYAALTMKNELVRYFNNNSGGNVDINEIMLALNHVFYGWVANCRDKLASTVTVPDTGQLKVTYTIQLTYPS